MTRVASTPLMTGQVDVHQDEVGLQHPNRLDGLLSGGDGAEHDEAVGGLHDGGHRTTERVLVVDDQDLHLVLSVLCHASMMTGGPVPPQGDNRTFRACWLPTEGTTMPVACRPSSRACTNSAVNPTGVCPHSPSRLPGRLHRVRTHHE